MPQSEDNNIDNLFKEAAVKSEFAYNPGFWTTMEKRLDLVRNTNLVWKGASLAVIIAVLGGMGYYELKTEKTQPLDVEIEQLSENSNNEMIMTQPEEIKSDPGVIAIDENSNNETGVDPAAAPQIVRPLKNTPQFNPGFAVNSKSPPANFKINQGDIVATEIGPDVEMFLLKSRPSDLPRVSMNIFDGDLQLLDVAKPKKTSYGNQFAIALSFAPDYSGVQFSGNKAGYGLGIGFGYSISERFSAGVGLLYANKRYDVVAKRYKSYNGAWANIPKPESIEANCDVIEIPINMRYYFSSNSKSKIFLSSGVSTYLMKSEDYVIHYSTSTGEMSAQNENNHFLSILNMSIGVEKQITNRFGIEIEPYLKFPLTGIGMGEVNLTSSGTFVTGKYYFGL